jgi:glycosyltransferase involved in cell wall biosynthesis
MPNALIEAVLAGLPVICHPHPGGKYILRDDQWFVDLSKSGALADRLRDLRCLARKQKHGDCYYTPWIGLMQLVWLMNFTRW